MGFQTVVNAQQAPAVAGDFASANPRHSMIALGLETALAAGPNGVTVGVFGWAKTVDGTVYSGSLGTNASKLGFVPRAGNTGLITTGYPPGDDTMAIPYGQPMTLFDGGDFWAKFAAGAAIGQKVFASYVDGSCVAGTAGTPITTAATASFATNVMTVTATGGNTLAPGMPVTSAGVAAGTYITAQTGGTVGGAGTYTLSSAPGTIASQAATITIAAETSFFVDSAAGNGELAIISTRS